VTYNNEVVGKITINAKQQTFVFNGRGLTAGRPYFLVGPGFRSIATVKANDNGTVHMTGDSVLWFDELADDTRFFLSMSPSSAGYNDVIFPKLTACYDYKPFWAYWNVKGYLTKEDTGEPLPNQEVYIYQFTSNGYVLRSIEITDNQGYFYYSRYASTLSGSIPISVIIPTGSTIPTTLYSRPMPGQLSVLNYG
jgi:hypothetical protein